MKQQLEDKILEGQALSLEEEKQLLAYPELISLSQDLKNIRHAMKIEYSPSDMSVARVKSKVMKEIFGEEASSRKKRKGVSTSWEFIRTVWHEHGMAAMAAGIVLAFGVNFISRPQSPVEKFALQGDLNAKIKVLGLFQEGFNAETGESPALDF